MSELMDILTPCLGEELAAAIIEHRKHTVKKPLTAYAAKLQVKEYLKTGNPKAAAEMQILRSWQAIRSDWYFNELRKMERAAIGQPSTKFRSIADAARERLGNSNHDFGLPRLVQH